MCVWENKCLIVIVSIFCNNYDLYYYFLICQILALLTMIKNKLLSIRYSDKYVHYFTYVSESFELNKYMYSDLFDKDDFLGNVIYSFCFFSLCCFLARGINTKMEKYCTSWWSDKHWDASSRPNQRSSFPLLPSSSSSVTVRVECYGWKGNSNAKLRELNLPHQTTKPNLPPNMNVRTLRPLLAFCSFSSSCWMTSWKESRFGAQLPGLFPAHLHHS